MEIKYFHNIALLGTFVVDGEAYIKRSELIYTDSLGMERYIDPLFDIKIGKQQEAGAKAAQLPGQPSATVVQLGVETVFGGSNTIQADQSGHVVLSDTDVERIARRVAEILKGQ